MIFKITAVKTIDDPIERRQRLTQLYAIFESAAESQVSDVQDVARVADQLHEVTQPTTNAVRHRVMARNKSEHQ